VQTSASLYSAADVCATFSMRHRQRRRHQSTTHHTTRSLLEPYLTCEARSLTCDLRLCTQTKRGCKSSTATHWPRETARRRAANHTEAAATGRAPHQRLQLIQDPSTGNDDAQSHNSTCETRPRVVHRREKLPLAAVTYRPRLALKLHILDPKH